MPRLRLTFKYEFEFDTDGYDPKFVDVEGLAKDTALRELKIDITNGLITEQDFYIEEIDS